MTPSTAGGVLLLLVGTAFLVAAAWTWLHGDGEPDLRRSLGIAVDVLVGLVALADGLVSFGGGPAQLPLWAAGSAALLIALVMLHRRWKLSGHHHGPSRRVRR